MNDLSDREKMELHRLIESELTRIEQMELLLKLMILPEEIYKMTSSCTMFDLNDVPIKNLRELYDYVMMTLSNKKRETEMRVVLDEHEQKLQELTIKLDRV